MKSLTNDQETFIKKLTKINDYDYFNLSATQLPFIVGVFGSSGTMMLNTNGAALQYAQAGC